MKRDLEEFIYKRLKNRTVTDLEDILDAFQEKTYRKGDFFKEQDTRVGYLGFLVSGSARSYFVNEKGEEISFEIHQEKGFLQI